MHYCRTSSLAAFNPHNPPFSTLFSNQLAAAFSFFLPLSNTRKRPERKGSLKNFEERGKFLKIHLAPCAKAAGVIMGKEKTNALHSTLISVDGRRLV